MDLANYRPTTASLAINDKFGQPTDMKVTLIGTESKPFREAVYRLSREQMARKDASDVEQAERDTVRLLAACVVGWENVTDNGVPVPCTPDAAFELLFNPEFKFIREQVDAFASVSENFFPRSSGQADPAGSPSGEAGDDGQAGGKPTEVA